MSEFRVTPESLMLGSTMINTSGAGGGGERFSYGGAAARTPAAGAWSDFVDAAGRSMRDTVQEARVRANEVLTGSEVQELFLSYYRTGDLPGSYTRREIEL